MRNECENADDDTRQVQGKPESGLNRMNGYLGSIPPCRTIEIETRRRKRSGGRQWWRMLARKEGVLHCCESEKGPKGSWGVHVLLQLRLFGNSILRSHGR